jgi:hypothetical protein
MFFGCCLCTGSLQPQAGPCWGLTACLFFAAAACTHRIPAAVDLPPFRSSALADDTAQPQSAAAAPGVDGMPRGTALPEPAGRTAGATGDGCESGHPAAVAHGGATATAAGAKRPPVPPPPATSSSSHTHSTAMERLTAAAADALGPVPAPSPAVAVQVPLRYRGMRLYRLPYSPPSVEAVQLWLARHPLPAAAGGATAAAAAAARQRHTGDMHQQQQQQRQTAAASFRLDSTTGRFIPVTPGAASRALPSLSRRLSAVGPQSLTTSHPALGASQEGGPPPGAPGPDLDLACTPALLLSDPSQYREGGLQQQQLGSGGLGGSQQQDGAGQEQELEAGRCRRLIGWRVERSSSEKPG